MNSFHKKLVLTLGAILLTLPSAHAQATRTWVSGVGDDANPCSRTAPCKTFAGAISKTAANGEIDVLDPGGFGAVTITKSITISGHGIISGVLVSGTNGIVINAGANDTVILRGLTIAGVGTGLSGIHYLSGGALVVEDCTIDGFIQNGIDAILTNSGRLTVRNTAISGGQTGVKVTSTFGKVSAVLTDVSIRASAIGVDGQYGLIEVNHSTITESTSYGVLAEGGSINVNDSLLAANSVAVQAQTGATVRLSNNDIYDNLTGMGCGGGTLASAGNNKKANNTGGVVAVCSPTATITLQ
jgi:hypothetical protein